MLNLFVVLLSSGLSDNQHIAPYVGYKVPIAGDIKHGGDYNLTCVVQGRNTDRATWLKDGEEVGEQDYIITQENHTRSVTYRIQNFSSKDVGNYTCSYEYVENNEVKREHGEILHLEYRPVETKNLKETEEKRHSDNKSRTERNVTINKTSAREKVTTKLKTVAPAKNSTITPKNNSTIAPTIIYDGQITEKPDEITTPKTTAYGDREICISMKKHRSYYDNRYYYRAGDVMLIPENCLLTDVVTINAKMGWSRRYPEWPYDDRFDYFGSYHPKKYPQNWDWNTHKRTGRRNEQNIGISPKDLSFEGESHGAITQNGKKLSHQQNKKYGEKRPMRPMKDEVWELLSIKQRDGVNKIDVNIRKVPYQGRALQWSVSGILNRTVSTAVFHLDQNNLKLQLSYNPATKSLQLTSSERTRYIDNVTYESIQNLNQIKVGTIFNSYRNDIYFEHMHISICRQIPPSISLSVELRKDFIHLICTATGSPFLTIKWTTLDGNGGRMIRGRKEWTDEEDGTSLTLGLTLYPSELQSEDKAYTCHVSSTSSRGSEVSKSITLKGEDYTTNKERTDCQQCPDRGSGMATQSRHVKERYDNGYHDTAGYSAKKVLTMALGGISGFFLIVLVTQYIIIKVDEENKDVEKEEEVPAATGMKEKDTATEAIGMPHGSDDTRGNVNNEAEVDKGGNKNENAENGKTEEKEKNTLKIDDKDKEN